MKHTSYGSPRAIFQKVSLALVFCLGALATQAPSASALSIVFAERDGEAHRWMTYGGGYDDSYHFLGGDFDGDGHEDIARVFGLPDGTTAIDLLKSDGTAFQPLDWGRVQLGGFWPGQHYLVGDFDGNGRDDIARIFNDGGFVSIDALLSTGVNFWYTRWATRLNPYGADIQFAVGDFNGDDLADVAQISNDQGLTTIDVFQSGGPTTVVRWTTRDGGYGADMHFVAGNFDGDGDDDLARLFRDGDHLSIDLMRSSGSSFAGERWSTHVGRWIDGAEVHGGDFNDDGFDDLARVELDGRGLTSDLYLSWGQDFERLELFQTAGWAHCTVAGDFDGDGLAEIAGIDGRYALTTVDLYDQPLAWETNGRAVRWASGSGAFAGTQRYLDGDFNGDGKQDVARVFNQGGTTSIDLHMNVSDGFVYHRWISTTGTHAPSQWFLSGDFNGDGADDIVKVWNHAGATSLDIYLGGSSGFTWQPWLSRQGGHWDGMRFVAGDFDGDGLDDVAKIWNHHGLATVDVYRSFATGFHTFAYWAGQQGGFWPEQQYVSGDYDGDGKDDIARVFADGIYTSVDVLRSQGSHFAHQRWMTQRGLSALFQKHVSGDFDGDGKDDLVKYGRNAGLETAMLLYRSAGSSFEDHYFIEDSLPFAETAKVMAADFDGDGLAEVATAYRTQASHLTNFDVYGGSLERHPGLLVSAGDTRRYSPAEAQANLLQQGFSLVASNTLVPGQCTVVYPNAYRLGTSRDVGTLACATLHPLGRLLMHPVYGGCDVGNSGGQCSIGIFEDEISVEVGGVVTTFSVQGPGAQGCAEVSRDSLCADIAATLWETSILVGDGNGTGAGAGVFVGVGAGGQAGYSDGVLSGSLELGLGPGVEIHYSVNGYTAVSVGESGFEYTQEGVDAAITQGGAVVNDIKNGVTEAWDYPADLVTNVLNDIGSTARDVFCKVFC